MRINNRLPNTNKFKEDLVSLKNIFLKHKKKIIFFSLLTNLLLIFAYVIVGVKLFYPYHFRIGFSLYLLSFVLFFYLVYYSRRTFKLFNTFKFTKNYYKTKKIKIIYLIITFLILISFFTILPYFNTPFEGLEDKEIQNMVNRDLELSILLMDKLEISNINLIKNLKENNTLENRNNIKSSWEDFVISILASEVLTEKHKYFYNLPSNLNESKSKSFMISYSLYIKKYELIQKLIPFTHDNKLLIKILDEKIDSIDNNDIYTKISSNYYHPKTWLRMDIGRGYLGLINNNQSSEDANYILLKDISIKSYDFLEKENALKLSNAFAVFENSMEYKMFSGWYPIQKNIADTMKLMFLSFRDYKFITLNQIEVMKDEMEPGDIMVQRRNWYMTNVGIPGFWTHSALYTGSLEDMNSYFTEIFPYDNHVNFSSYLESINPKIFKLYLSRDSNDFEFSVIESKANGVELYSLEESAYADYIGVLRPRLEKIDKMKSLLRAFENFGKPYDFDFDFETRDELVCSELIYDSYLENSEKNGLHLDLSLINGRKIFTPTNFVIKYSNEYNNQSRELDFVYFLDGNENLQQAYVKNESEFINSLTRSKFDWYRE